MKTEYTKSELEKLIGLSKGELVIISSTENVRVGKYYTDVSRMGNGKIYLVGKILNKFTLIDTKTGEGYTGELHKNIRDIFTGDDDDFREINVKIEKND